MLNDEKNGDISMEGSVKSHYGYCYDVEICFVQNIGNIGTI